MVPDQHGAQNISMRELEADKESYLGRKQDDEGGAPSCRLEEAS